MLTIWGRRSAFNVQKVLWLMGELGLAYERIEAGGDFGGLDDPAFRTLNPHGRVPLLRDGDVLVWESHAILRYLAARHGEGTFWSPDPARRVAADGWMDWSQTALQPAFLTGVFWGGYRTPEALRDEQALAAALERANRLMRRLEAQLEGRDYLLGETLSLADIPTGTNLYRYFELEIDRPSLPRVEAWYARLQARPAYAEHVMVPFGDLKGRLAF
ncbi:MAG: glutathione S-transferase [Caulobacter sp.]|nr:glutathione S-transferase [Caulobacter sp.]